MYQALFAGEASLTNQKRMLTAHHSFQCLSFRVKRIAYLTRLPLTLPSLKLAEAFIT